MGTPVLGLVDSAKGNVFLWKVHPGEISNLIAVQHQGDNNQVTKFELIVNQRVAKSIGITIPPTMLGLADEVID